MCYLLILLIATNKLSLSLSLSLSLLRLLRRELEGDVLTSQLLIHPSKRFQLVLRLRLFGWVQIHLQQLRTIQSVSLSLSHNLSRVHQILEQTGVHGGQRSRTRSRSRKVRFRHRANSSVTDKNNVFVRELLFQLSHQSLLDLVERLQVSVRDVDDDDGAVRNRNFCRAANEEVFEVRF